MKRILFERCRDQNSKGKSLHRVQLTTVEKNLQKYFPFLLTQVAIKSKCKKYGRATPLKMRSLEKPFTLPEGVAEKALKDNEGLLKKVLKKYTGITIKYGLHTEELEQIGKIGLLRGYEAFLEHKHKGGSGKVSTFVVHAIDWDILDFLYTNFSLVRIPKSTLNKKLDEIKKKLKEEGDIDELQKSRVPNLPILVLFDPIKMENTGYEETDGEASILAETINSAIKILPHKEMRAVKGYYLEGLSLDDLSKELNMTKEGIRQKREAGLKKIRESSLANKLRDFYED